ncbi:MAG TPA: efflux RND transporter permease subunit [Longimicrobiales bacterium]|nr:efflux RND transporter permease subunit [Longimicrobiales bacterium]
MIRLSIRRPVAVAMTYAAVALLGVAAWRNIPIELLPDTQLPRLTVTGRWRGASPETVEAFLTSPLEGAIQQVQGVEKIISESYEENGTGTAQIQVEFARDTDMDFARLDLAERLSTLEEELPPGADRVVVEPYVPEEFQDQNRPFLQYTFTGPYTLEALRRHVDDVVVPDVGQVEGVGVVRVFGGRERRLEVQLDDQKIAALGLDPWTVRQRIQELDLVQEVGVVREGDAERTITIVNRPETAGDVRDAIITAAGGTPVRVADIATVHDTYEEARVLNRVNGRPAVTFTVTKAIGANTVRVADVVKEHIDGLQRLSPYGSRMILENDESKEIREQLTDLRTRALFSALVIFVVLLGFLRSFRSAVLIFATIGFSVLIALNLIYFGGLTLNILTLMGLAMGFGLVVDNAIVVLENVYRRWRQGEAAGQAAGEGAREVVLPILASTATTLIVFVPFVYLQGELRVFYVPLAVVVGLTLVASLFVAFTFIPALAARVLALGARGEPLLVDGTARSGPGGASGAPPRRPLYLRFYSDVVGFTVRHPWVAGLVTALAFSGSYYLFDQYVTTWTIFGGGYGTRTYISVNISLPRGSNLDRTDQLVSFFEQKLAEMPEVEQYTSVVYENRGYMEITFPDSLENSQVPVAIKEQMFAYSHSFTGAEVRVYGYGPSFYGGGSSPPNYAITVLGYNYERVRDIAEDLGRRLSRLSRVQEVDTNASSGRFNRDKASEYVVTIDRDKLARHNMTVEALVNRLVAAVAGNARLGYLKLGGEEVQYQVKLEANQDMDVLALTETLVDTPDGQRIRLGDVVAVTSKEILARIRRENQQYERTVAYEFRGPQKLGDLFNDRVIEATQVPPGYTVKKGDTYYWINPEDQAQIWMVIAVALLLVYMVTAALFESMLQPLCVIFTVPMALIGVYLIFFYTGASFTREAYIGVIMMFGIVVNNAILLVDHVNGVRRRNPELALEDAIVRGTLERVRPILMTTATTVLGLLPLVVFGGGAGSNIWDALALVLIGGLLSSTLFVLTITPAAYGVLERWKVGRRRHVGAPALHEEPALG